MCLTARRVCEVCLSVESTRVCALFRKTQGPAKDASRAVLVMRSAEVLFALGFRAGLKENPGLMKEPDLGSCVSASSMGNWILIKNQGLF